MSKQGPFWANPTERIPRPESKLRGSLQVGQVAVITLVTLSLLAHWPIAERNYVLANHIPILLDSSYTREFRWQESYERIPMLPCLTEDFDAMQCARVVMASVDAGATLATINIPLDALRGHPGELSIAASYAGEVWYRAGRTDEALTVWLGWLAPLQRIDTASRLFEAGNLDDAISLVDSLDPNVKIDSGIRKRKLTRIVVAAAKESDKRKDFAAAADYWRRAIVQRPEQATYHFNLAVLLESQRKWEESLTALRKAVQLRPDSISYQVRLVRALKNLGRLEEAQKAAQQALVLDPTNQTVLSILESLDP